MIYKSLFKIISIISIFNFSALLAQDDNFICGAVRTLQTLDHQYKSLPRPNYFLGSTQVNNKRKVDMVRQRKTISNFVRTGCYTGEYGEYQGINYERYATEAEREIIYTVIIDSATDPNTNEDVFVGYKEGLRSLLTNKLDVYYQQAYFHQLTAYTVAYLAYEERKNGWGQLFKILVNPEDEEYEYSELDKVTAIDDDLVDTNCIPSLSKFKDSIRESETFKKAMISRFGVRDPKPYIPTKDDLEEIEKKKQNALRDMYNQKDQIDKFLQAKEEGRKLYLFVGRGNNQPISERVQTLTEGSLWVYLDMDVSTIDFRGNNFLWGDVYKVMEDPSLKDLFSGIVFDKDVLHWLGDKRKLMEICHQILDKNKKSFVILEKRVQYIISDPEYGDTAYTFNDSVYPTSIILKRFGKDSKETPHYNETHRLALNEAYQNIEEYLKTFYEHVSTAEYSIFDQDHSVTSALGQTNHKEEKLLQLINFNGQTNFFIAKGPRLSA